MKWELFMSTFCLVYLLGVQQLNVQGNHILLAMLTSLAIGTANLLVIRGASVLDWHSTVDVVLYLSGGVIGIASAMRTHHLLLAAYAATGLIVTPTDSGEINANCEGRGLRKIRGQRSYRSKDAGKVVRHSAAKNHVNPRLQYSASRRGSNVAYAATRKAVLLRNRRNAPSVS
jgi:hypothetical protein